LHDTDDRLRNPAPAGVTAGSMVQVVPFHASARVCAAPVLSLY